MTSPLRSAGVDAQEVEWGSSVTVTCDPGNELEVEKTTVQSFKCDETGEFVSDIVDCVGKC